VRSCAAQGLLTGGCAKSVAAARWRKLLVIRATFDLADAPSACGDGIVEHIGKIMLAVKGG
jgi:hypothetical protein